MSAESAGYKRPLDDDYISKGALAIRTNADISFKREKQNAEQAKKISSELGTRATVSTVSARGTFDSLSSVGGIFSGNFRPTWVQIAEDGSPTAATISILKSKFGYSEVLGSKESLYLIGDNFRGAPFSDLINAQSQSETLYSSVTLWAHYGDSLTDWGTPEALAELTGYTHINAGIAGNTSTQVAIRAGARPYQVKLAGDIPASGKVQVEKHFPIFLPMETNLPHSVEIAGVTGTLTRYGTNPVYFNRAGTGDPVPVTGWQEVLIDPAEGTEKQTQGNRAAASLIIGIGRNDLLRNGNIETVIQNIKRIIDANSAKSCSVLIWAIPPWRSEAKGTAAREKLDSWNQKIADAFPGDFVDPSSYLRSVEAFTELGITPTPQDTQDIQDGLTPASFRRDTAGHFNDSGNRAWARFMFNEMNKRGFIRGE